MVWGSTWGDEFGYGGGRSLAAAAKVAQASRPFSLTYAEKLDAERCATFAATRTPVVVLTGFLGAGKTTLLNRLLRLHGKNFSGAGSSKDGLKLAVIENEVGAVSVDDALLPKGARDAGAEEVIVMPNGCLCCRTRGDLKSALRLADRGSARWRHRRNECLSSSRPCCRRLF